MTSKHVYTFFKTLRLKKYHDVEERYKNNFRLYSLDYITQWGLLYPSMYSRRAIVEAFQWDRTEEDFDYWSNLNNLYTTWFDNYEHDDRNVLDFLLLINDEYKDVLKKFNKNLKELSSIYKGNYDICTPDAIHLAFAWNKTSEGINYWKEISEIYEDWYRSYVE